MNRVPTLDFDAHIEIPGGMVPAPTQEMVTHLQDSFGNSGDSLSSEMDIPLPKMNLGNIDIKRESSLSQLDLVEPLSGSLGSLPEMSSQTLGTMDFNDLPSNPDLPSFTSSDDNLSGPASCLDSRAFAFPESSANINTLNTISYGELPTLSDNNPSINLINAFKSDSNSDSEKMSSLSHIPVLGTSNSKPALIERDTPEGILIRACSACRKPIDRDGQFIDGLYYHEKCVTCMKCKSRIKQPQCIVYKNRLFCISCSQKNPFSIICPACKCKVCHLDDHVQIKALNRIVHKECFTCYTCCCQLYQQNYDIVGDHTFCYEHASESTNRKCQTCKEPIFGDYRYFCGRFYHINHMQCTVCHDTIIGDKFVQHHNRIYCMNHGLIYSDNCAFCKRPCYSGAEEIVSWHRKKYHTVCFVCRVCGKHLSNLEAKCFHSRPHCETCFNKRKSENDETYLDHPKHAIHHFPEISTQRQKRYSSVCQIIYPSYTPKEMRLIEKVVYDEPEEARKKFSDINTPLLLK